MDLNGLIRLLTRKFLHKAVNAGVDYAARRGKPEAEMTPEERAQAQRGREMAQRAKEISKVTRRFWR
ncbi:MAG TPA: hypothetical protein VK146_02235 [Tabrizicola sp.]|nr:hypothetical protein [Tabrizicola sp.]